MTASTEPLRTTALDAAGAHALAAREAPQMRADLEALTRIPSIAFEGFPREEVLRGAEATAALLRAAGAQAELVDPGEGIPAVHAFVPGPEGAPTVVLYAHYDVQPAGDLAAWTSPPFEPTERGGRLYGRGAADDKSGVVLHAATLRAFGGKPPVGLRIIIEGEEEWGGAFEEYVTTREDWFGSAAAMVVADMGNVRLGEPTFTTGLRGAVEAYVSIRTLRAPAHSGMFGGPAPDALLALIRMLDTLLDEAGDVAVEGAGGYEWDGGQYPDDDYRDQAGIVDGQPLIGTGSLSSRLFSRPAIAVVGLDAPPVAGAINAVQPTAGAKVSMRIPPGVDPIAAQDALVAHLKAHAPWGVQVDVTPGRPAAGVSLPTDNAPMAAARRALAASYGRDCVDIGAGGSVPLVANLHRAFPDLPMLLFGAQDPKASIHAPDESVHLGELEAALAAQVLFLAELAASS